MHLDDGDSAIYFSYYGIYAIIIESSGVALTKPRWLYNHSSLIVLLQETSRGPSLGAFKNICCESNRYRQLRNNQNANFMAVVPANG